MAVTGMMMDLKRMAVHDGPGLRTTLFLKGCPLRCIWCHNPEGISSRSQLAYYAHKCIGCGQCLSACPRHAHSITAEGHVYDRTKCVSCGACVDACLGDALKLYGHKVTVEEALALALEDRMFYGETGGVTLSGGEPMLQKEFVLHFLKAAKAEKLHTAIDTCGCAAWEAYEAILPYADMFLYDIKHIDPEKHRLLTGQSNERILDNLKRLSDAGKCIEIRMPLVPGCNDDPETLEKIGEYLGQMSISKMRVLPYHSLARSKYASLGLQDTMPDVPSPSDEQIEAVVTLLNRHHVPAVSGRA